MAREQVVRWALDHPTCPKTGRYMEVPFLTQTLPRVLGVIGLAGALWYANPLLLWHKKPVSWTPEFIAEAKAIGEVAVSLETETFRFSDNIVFNIDRDLRHSPLDIAAQQRMNAPPVFLNPFRNRIPGNITGPEDLKTV